MSPEHLRNLRNKASYSEHAMLASEEYVTLSDRQFVVIGTAHGTDTFPGVLQTNTEISRFESLIGNMNGLAIDGQRDLSDPTIKNSPFNPQVGFDSQEMTAFSNWGVVTAVERKIPLIGADPLIVVSGLANIIEYEIWKSNLSNIKDPVYEEIIKRNPQTDYDYAHINQRLNEYWNTKYALDDKEKKKDEWNAKRNLLTAGIIGSAILYGFYEKRRLISRRGFLKLGAGGFTAGLIEGIVHYYRQKAIEVVKKASQVEDEANEVYQRSKFDPFLVGEEDEQYVAERLQQDTPLTDDDYNKPQFQRFQEYQSLVKKYTDLLRHAFIAEVLSVPSQDLLGAQVPIPLKVPIVMGTGHLTVKKEHRISTLLQDEKSRRELLKTLLQALYKGIPNLMGNENVPGGRELDRGKMFEDFKTYMKTYWVARDGEVKVHPFRIKAIDEIVDSIR